MKPQLFLGELLEEHRGDPHTDLLCHSDIVSRPSVTYCLIEIYMIFYGASYTMQPTARRVIHGLVTMVYSDDEGRERAFKLLESPATFTNVTTS